jgi:hypothetical protein
MRLVVREATFWIMIIRGRSGAISIRKVTAIPRSRAPIDALLRERSVSHLVPHSDTLAHSPASIACHFP